MLDAFAPVVGLRVGLDCPACGLEAEQRPCGGVGLAHHVVGLAGQFQRLRRGKVGFVGGGEAALRARRGDDEQGGVFELRGVAGVQRGDLRVAALSRSARSASVGGGGRARRRSRVRWR